MPLFDLLKGPGAKEKVETIGVAGFKATVTTRETIEANASAPTAWLEDGSHANDHIILDPITKVVEGNVGDVYLESSPTLERFREIAGPVGRVTPYLPDRTQAQLQRAGDLAATVRDGLIAAQSAVRAGRNVFDLFGNQDDNKPLGEQFVDRLLKIRAARELVPVEFNSKRFDNMAIVGLSVTRDNENGNAIEYEITFQQLRFAETTFADPASGFPNASDALDGKTDGMRDKGVQAGKDAGESLASQIKESIFGD